MGMLWSRERLNELPGWPLGVALCGRFPQIPILNLSAHFVAQLQNTYPYVNHVIGSEAQASANGLSDPKDIPTIAKALTHQPKSDPTCDYVLNCMSLGSLVNLTFCEDGLQH